MHSSSHQRKRTRAVSPAPLFIQPKLAVNAQDDKYEQEANRVSDKVMQTPASDKTQQASGQYEGKEEKRLQRKPANISSVSRTQATECSSLHPGIENRLNSSKGVGFKIDDTTQSFMSNRFGVDFSQVKIHTDNEAVQMNRELNANAFTNGSDVYFNEGKYQPGSDQGKKLLAHELTHVTQQRAGHILIQKDDKGKQPADSKGVQQVAANDILPFKKGERVLITNLIPDSMLAMAARFAEDSADILTMLRDPDLQSLVATISVSTPDRVEANISIPATPAKGDRAAVGATDMVIRVVRLPDGSFELAINSTGAKKIQSSISPITASRGANGGVILSADAKGPKVSISPPDAKGQRVAEATDVPLIGSLKLVSLSELKSETGTAAEATEIKDKSREAKALVKDKRHEIRAGAGVQDAKQADWLAYVGWRFTFKPLADIVQVPLTVQVEYVPKDDFLVDVSSGVQTTLPTKVPVTLRVDLGIKGGVVSDPENQEGVRTSHPVGGITLGGGLSIPLGKSIRVEADAKHLFDVIGKGGGGVTTYSLGLSIPL